MRGSVVSHHELQFGAEQADAGGAGVLEMRKIDGEAGIDHQRDLLAVLGDARPVAQRAILRLPARAQLYPLAIGRLDILRRAHVHMAGRAVHDDGVAGLDQAGGIGDFADGRNAERARHDRDMRGRPAFLQHQAAQSFAVVVEQRRRTHGARDHDGVFRQLLFSRRVILAHQHPHQAVGEVVEVVQAVAQIRIGGAQHAGAGVGLHALDAGFGGETGRHRFADLVQPALVVREHAIGFEHVAMLAAVGDVAVLDHAVEIGAQGSDRGIEPLELARHVVGDHVGDDDARLVQHHVAERDAVGQRGAGEMHRMARGRLGAGLGERGQLAGGDHLGEHHRRRLQRFFFLFGVGAARAVLHHQHAERIAGAQDRHAEERMIDFFAGFRPVGEGRMRLRVRQVDRIGFAGDQADQAFVGFQHGLVDGFVLQALGGV